MRRALLMLALAAAACGEPPAPVAPPPVDPRPAPPSTAPGQKTALPRPLADPRVQPETSPDGTPLLQVTPALVGRYVVSHTTYAAALAPLAAEIRQKQKLAPDDAKGLTADPEFRARARAAAEASTLAAGLTIAEEARVAAVVEEVMVARHFTLAVARLPVEQREAATVAGASKLLTVRRKYGEAQVDAVLAHAAALEPLPDLIANALGVDFTKRAQATPPLLPPPPVPPAP